MKNTFPDHIVRNKGFLQNLAKTKSEKKKKALLKAASDEELSVLVDIIFNLLNHNLILHQRRKRTLAPYAPTLRAISRVRTAQSARRILNQEGGSLPLSTLLIPLLVQLISS